VCPGYSVDFDSLNKFIFGKIPNNVLGNYINCYLGYATDYEMRWNSSSGGLVTALLVFALQENLIDGALITRMRIKNPLEPEVVIARSVEDIVSGSGSKYCPVPLNVAVRALRKGEKYAVVGLPCHIHGIRKAEIVDIHLREKIALHFGIFCSHTVSFHGTEFLLKRIGILEEDIAQISYRGKGWPGGMCVKMKNGNEIFVSSQEYWGNLLGSFFFTPIRCFSCYDALNDLADISFGDAWLPEIMKKDKIGTSIVMIRTKKANRLLKKAILRKKIVLTEIQSDDVIRSQAGTLNYKKKGLKARFKVMRMFNKPLPAYNDHCLEKLRPDVRAYTTLISYANIYITSNSHFSKLLKHTPSLILKLYAKLIAYLHSLTFSV